MSRYISIIFALFLAATLGFASDAKQPNDRKQKDQPAAILPASFNGWQIDRHDAKSGSDPDAADPADSAALKEYGFTGYETAAYTRDDRKMQVKAARFNDATGAYGAFSYYVNPQMRTESIGDRAASSNTRVLFYRGNILVQVMLDRITAMSASELRALADTLPRVQGEAAQPPSLPGNLPRQSLIANSAHYVVGPVALARVGVPIPANLVDFSMAPEVEIAHYNSSVGEANLTLIKYPTPQIAAQKLKAIKAADLPGGPYYFKRTGPILAAVNGFVPETEADSLLASVNYDADVTWNQATKPSAKDDVFSWMIALVSLIGIIFVIALAGGFAFGGVRILLKKFFPKRFFDRPEDLEIIKLNLR